MGSFLDLGRYQLKWGDLELPEGRRVPRHTGGWQPAARAWESAEQEPPPRSLRGVLSTPFSEGAATNQTRRSTRQMRIEEPCVDGHEATLAWYHSNLNPWPWPGLVPASPAATVRERLLVRKPSLRSDGQGGGVMPGLPNRTFRRPKTLPHAVWCHNPQRRYLPAINSRPAG